MKQSVATITPDRRLQLLLVAFCFGAFIEGAAGFGAPVAIARRIHDRPRFKPFHAAALNLIATPRPLPGAPSARRCTRWLWSPQCPKRPEAMIGRICHSRRSSFRSAGARDGQLSKPSKCWPAILCRRLSFAGMQFFWSNYMAATWWTSHAGVTSMLAR